MWKNIIEMAVPVASLIVSLAALLATVLIGKHSIALTKETLSQAREVANRASADWRQQQWFSLFVEANSAHDLLERFQSVIASPGGSQWEDMKAALDAVTLQMKRVHGLAVVFPKCAEIDALFQTTSGYFSQKDYSNKAKSDDLLEALEGIRQKALVSPDVLQSGK